MASTDPPPAAPAAASSAPAPAAAASAAATNPNPHTPLDASPKYHALIVDSGAIIKQPSLTGTSTLLSAASNYYTVPAVLAEIRDAKSRSHLEQFQLRLQSLHEKKLEARVPSKEGVRKMSEFARKTGDYPQLSGVDLQVLALLYDLEVEASGLHNGGNLEHVRRDPKRVLGVHVQALNGDGKRQVQRRGRGDSAASSMGSGSVGGNSFGTNRWSGGDGHAAFFGENADGIIDAAHVDLEYDEEEGDEDRDDATAGANATAKDNGGAKAKQGKSWAVLVNPERASTAPAVDYSIAASTPTEVAEQPKLDLKLNEEVAPVAEGQFDDVSSDEDEDEDDEGEDAFSRGSDEDGELDAIDVANAASDVELSDEECDVFVLDPHEAAYYKKLREERARREREEEHAQDGEGRDASPKVIEEVSQAENSGLESEFPSLSAAAAVPHEGSDDEEPEELAGEETNPDAELAWQKEEEERKKRALLPMVNGRVVHDATKASYNSFRRYKGVVSKDGAAAARRKQQKEREESQTEEAAAQPVEEAKEESHDAASDNRAYKSRIIGAAAGDFPSQMTAEDDDGEGWVTCARDIQSMKATGSLRPDAHSHKSNNAKARQKKNAGPPIGARAACATTDFAMQNVILQMNLELLSVDGVRVRRLKTWVTRCGACFTIYGNDAKSQSGGRLFCDKCGSDALQRIAASVDRNTGRLKLHMKKHYQYNTRGTKYALPKAGKANKYEGDLLLAEDQLLYGAWNQKVRKGKGKGAGQSIFGSDLASDLGCHADLSKRDDIRVGFGRRNPNATKFGRERRGKKKKNTADKACGLRRY